MLVDIHLSSGPGRAIGENRTWEVVRYNYPLLFSHYHMYYFVLSSIRRLASLTSLAGSPAHNVPDNNLNNLNILVCDRNFLMI